MGFTNILLDQGYVPAGTQPKTVVEEGGDPGYYQTDPLSNMLRGLTKFQKQDQERTEKKQKEISRQAEMYKTLREAGYNPKKAYEAVMRSVFTEPGPEDNDSPKKPQREKILEKIARDETLTEGEQKLYDEAIKHKSGDTRKEETPSQSKVRGMIMDKVAKGLALTPGEQKIYDDTIKKGSPNPKEDLDAIISGGKTQDGMVNVTAPDGRKGKVPAARLEEFLKKGYKKR